ncbi:MAG: glycosyltransferase family 4 protein [Candidatus Woesearchaeota archaeon]
MRYKILIILPYFGKRIGGMERFVIEIIKELKKNNFEITLLTGKTKEDIKDNNIKGIKIIRKKIFYPKIFNKFVKYTLISYYAKKHLEKNKYDYVLAMGFSGFLLKNHIWRASGPPMFIVENEKMKKLNFISKIINKIEIEILKKIEKKCIKNASFLIYPSKYMKELFENEYKLDNLKDLKPFFIPCSGIRINKRIIIKSKKILNVLTVGGLSEERKGKNIILEAFEKLEKKFKLIAVGNLDNKTIEELKKRKINAKILGFIDYEKINQIYNKADIFILPSNFEGFPNTILEAASFGLPVITTNLEGLNEYFKKDDEILVVEKNNSQELIEKIKFLEDIENRKRLSKKIYKKIKKLNYEVFCKKLIFFLENKKPINMLND